MAKIQLGDTVQDTISGLKGIAVGRTEWLYGCSHIVVASKVGKDGDIPKNHSFDEPQVKLVRRKPKPTTKPRKTGGPRVMPQMKTTPSKF